MRISNHDTGDSKTRGGNDDSDNDGGGDGGGDWFSHDLEFDGNRLRKFPFMLIGSS